MKYLLITFGLFWLLFYFWYVTGGPLRNDTSKPFVRPKANGGLEYFGKGEQ